MSGRKADVIKAAHLCAEAALRLVKPGNQVSAPGPGGLERGFCVCRGKNVRFRPGRISR